MSSWALTQNVTLLDFENITYISPNDTTTNLTSHRPQGINWTVGICIRVALFSLIFICTVIGNMLVILTLAQNKRMRTVTNVFLLNLAFSDLLLGVFCMPFTLVGSLLRNFVFGGAMCKLIPYAQAVSVTVSVWTLVSISLERFFAICRPLQSRRWQTVSHAYKVILLTWVASLLTMSPAGLLSKLTATKAPGKFKCREEWPNDESERAFNLYLLSVLFIIPLIIMSLVYSLIVRTLWVGMKLGYLTNHNDDDYHDTNHISESQKLHNNYENRNQNSYQQSRAKKKPTLRGHHKKSEEAKGRVIRMLFVLVIEFFICWTPLYVVNTWALYDQGIYKIIGYGGVAVAQLLSYISACCNPITYCFLHSKFRQGFLAIMGCRGLKKQGRESFSTNTLQSVYSTRMATSELTEKADEEDQI